MQREWSTDRTVAVPVCGKILWHSVAVAAWPSIDRLVESPFLGGLARLDGVLDDFQHLAVPYGNAVPQEEDNG